MIKDRETLLWIVRHEAGHAFIGWKLGRAIHNVTIIGRDGSGGHVEWKAKQEQSIMTKTQMLQRIACAMAGRAAELVYYGQEGGLSMGVGAASQARDDYPGDLPKATQLALSIVRGYGMDSEIGQISLDVLAERYSTYPLAEKTLELAEKIISEQLNAAKTLIEENQDEFDSLVDELIKQNQLSEAQLTELLGKLPTPRQ